MAGGSARVALRRNEDMLERKTTPRGLAGSSALPHSY